MEPERTLLLSNLHLPMGVYVNVETKKDFEVIRQTVEGSIDTKKYSIVSSMTLQRTPDHLILVGLIM